MKLFIHLKFILFSVYFPFHSRTLKSLSLFKFILSESQHKFSFFIHRIFHFHFFFLFNFKLSFKIRLSFCSLCPEEWICKNIFIKKTFGYISICTLSHAYSAGFFCSWTYLAIIVKFECSTTSGLYVNTLKILKMMIWFHFCYTLMDQVLVIELYGCSLSFKSAPFVILSGFFGNCESVKIAHHQNYICLPNLTIKLFQIFQHISLFLLTMANCSFIILNQVSKLMIFPDSKWEIIDKLILSSSYHLQVI